MTQRLLLLRFVRHRHLYYLHHFSSFSSDSSFPSDIPPPQPQPQPNPKPSFSSYFSDVRANLHRQPPPQKPLSSPLPSKTNHLEEVRRNVAEYRSRSTQHDHFDTSSDSPAPSGRSFDAIKESVRYLLADSNPERNQGNFISRIRGNLNLKPGPSASVESPAIGGGSGGLLHSFGKGNKRGEDDKSAMRMHNYSELGSKLKTLRPEKKGKWFTLLELNERLAKLREIEENESQTTVGGISWRHLRDTIVNLDASEKKLKNKTLQRIDLLGQLDGTPSYLLKDPKDHLVEKYFHPDNMSSAEKLKMELKRVRDEFKMSESDCGTARVQVALLTTKIKHLSTVLHKKDKHSRRGLQAMVQRRKKLLKYLRRTDWDSYCLVLSKLGLRDNPDIKT